MFHWKLTLQLLTNQILGSRRCSFDRLPNIPEFWYFLVYRAPRDFTPVNLECAFGTKKEMGSMLVVHYCRQIYYQ